MKFKISNTLIFILIAVVFGAVSGWLGIIILGLNDFNLPFVGRVKYSTDNSGDQIIIQQPRTVVVEQAVQIKQIENDLLPTLANIYLVKKQTNILSQAYLPSEIISQGLMLTANGWMLTAGGISSASKNKYVAVGYQNKQYAITETISDEKLGLVFGKVNADNLTVARIGKSADLQLGQSVVLVDRKNNLEISTIKNIGYDFQKADDLILNSDSLVKQIFLSVDVKDMEDGVVVANMKGEIVGIVSSGKIIPSDYFSGLVNEVLQKKKISHPSLGLKYIDLAQIDGLINIAEKGAYIYTSPAKDSPAYGKIKEGDIIKKVNDTELNVYVSLAEAVSAYKPGNKVELSFFRGGVDQSVEVTLK